MQDLKEISISAFHNSKNKEINDAYFQEKINRALNFISLGKDRILDKKSALIKSMQEIHELTKKDLDFSDQVTHRKATAILGTCTQAKVYTTGSPIKDSIEQMNEEEIDKVYSRMNFLNNK